MKFAARTQPVRCVECGDVASDAAEESRLALDCDGDLAAFCAECWTAEFGNE